MGASDRGVRWGRQTEAFDSGGGVGEKIWAET